MANDKKLVREITPMDEDFAQWYTDIVKKAELVDYSSMRGCMVIMRPYGPSHLGEHPEDLRRHDSKNAATRMCAMPLFIPESLAE